MKMTKLAKKPETISDLVKLTDKENPKPDDLARLRKRLDDEDQLVRANEISEYALTTVIESVSSSALLKEVYGRHIAEKRKDLDYDEENQMVKMMINQVIICHLRLNAFEAFHAKKVRENLSITQALYYDKMLSSYQRRFQKACESLAKVKRLLSEAGLRDQQTKNKQSQSTLNSARIYKAMSE